MIVTQATFNIAHDLKQVIAGTWFINLLFVELLQLNLSDCLVACPGLGCSSERSVSGVRSQCNWSGWVASDSRPSSLFAQSIFWNNLNTSLSLNLIYQIGALIGLGYFSGSLAGSFRLESWYASRLSCFRDPCHEFGRRAWKLDYGGCRAIAARIVRQSARLFLCLHSVIGGQIFNGTIVIVRLCCRLSLIGLDCFSGSLAGSFRLES